MTAELMGNDGIQKPVGENGPGTSLSAKFLAVLPERERRLVLELANGEYHYTRAMLKAGYARSTANKQQRRVCERPRVRRALIAIEYEREGSGWLNNEQLRLIGVNVRSVRQIERRKLETEAEAEAETYMARFFARRR